MSTKEIAAECRSMAAQILDPPNSNSAVMFRAAADRLEAGETVKTALLAVMDCNHMLGAVSRPVADEARAALAIAERAEL